MLLVAPAEGEEEINPAFDLKTLVEKVRQVVYSFKALPVRMFTLNKHVMDDRGEELGLLADCKTRWSSTHDMLERMTKLQGSVAKALVDVKLGAMSFTEVEVASLQVSHGN